MPPVTRHEALILIVNTATACSWNPTSCNHSAPRMAFFYGLNFATVVTLALLLRHKQLCQSLVWIYKMAPLMFHIENEP